MKFKSKARYEGGGISGVTRIIYHNGNSIATGLGTFDRRWDNWVWCAKPEVQLFPIEKDKRP